MEGRQIGGDTFQDKVHLAVQHVAFTDQWPVAALLFKGRQVDLGLTDQANHGENLHLEAQRASVHIRMIAADQPMLFQRAHTPQTGRSRDPHAFGQFHVGHATVGLKFGQNHTVDGVKFACGH